MGMGMGGMDHINNNGSNSELSDLRVEGFFRRRNCKIIKINPSTSTSKVVAATIARKRSAAAHHTTILFSDDIFTLDVQPGFDPELIMAFVIILDHWQ